MKNLAFMQDKLIDSYSFAKTVADKMGTRLATLPDLITIRTNTDFDESLIWNRWMTPATTLYFGTINAKRFIVVAHHLGPLTTQERIETWSRSGYNDKGSDRKAYGTKGLPKITQKEFVKLVHGAYGEVTTINFDKYASIFKKHLQGNFIFKDNALQDPLLKALFGKDFEKFVEKHYEISSLYAKTKNKEETAKEKILELRITDRYGWDLLNRYSLDFPRRGNSVALFLTLGNPSCYGTHDLSIATQIRTQEDASLSNFVVFNDPQADIQSINFSPEQHYKKCFVPANGEQVNTPYALMQLGKKYFIQYPKEGARMDTFEAMFPVTTIKKIGKLSSFQTNIYGSPFLKFDIDEVRAVMPESANAYALVGDVMPGNIVTVPVQFYKVAIDSSQRILRSEEVMQNLPLLLSINKIDL